MHRKTVLPAHKMLDGASLGASVTSDPTCVEFINAFNFYIACTGTPTGTLTVEYSPDYNPSKPAPTPTWVPLSLSLTALVGADQDYVINITQDAPMRWVRVKYVRTSGTGAITATISGKET